MNWTELNWTVWTSCSWAEIKNVKTNFLAYAKQLDENKHMGLDDWISQVVILKQVIAWIVRDIWYKCHLWYFKIGPNFM